MQLPLTARQLVAESGFRLTEGGNDLVPTIDRSFEDRAVTRPASNWLAFLGEVLVAISAALVSVQLSRSIDVNPLDRLGQVSGLAALELRFMVLGLLVLVATIVAVRVGRPWAFPLVSRLACAAVAGLSTGLIAGGLVVALRGSDWPLYADWGDAGRLAEWADSVMAGGSMPAEYPPLAVHLMVWWAELTNGSVSGALQLLQVVGTALFGPVAYLSWRLLLRPVWALGIGCIAAIPLIDLYKPYTNVVLVALLPIVIWFLQLLRRSETISWRRITFYGAVAGAAAGVLFLTYSGWFVWSAPGVFVAVLVVFPWRTGFRRGLVLLVTASAVFVGVAFPHLLGILRAAGATSDTYFYFDTYVEPAYIAMWRSDLPGNTGPWPPPGELGGVGLFTVLLVVGLGVAVALGGRRTVVLVLGCCLASALLMRFQLASQMYTTQSVQLYPRTTPEILHCLLLIFGFAVYFASQRLGHLLRTFRMAGQVGELAQNQGTSRSRPFRLPTGSSTIGALCAVLLFSLFAGSAIADRYMPRADNSLASLAYLSQMVEQEDGTCPAYSRPDGCAKNAAELMERLRNGH